MSTVDSVREHAGRAHKNLASSPLISWILGALVLLLWACATVTQVETSEYLALGTTQAVSGISWNVFLQPWYMLTLQVPVAYQTAWAYAWIVEACTLVVSMKMVVAYTKIGGMNSALGKGFIVAAFLLVILNSYADFNSSPGSNGMVKFLVALAIGLITTCGLPLGIGLIEHGCEQY